MNVGSESGNSNSQDVELNLAPIIDCLVVLVSFMLISAAFLSINLIDAGIAAGGAAPTDQTPPPVALTLKLEPSQTLQIKVEGKVNQTFTIRPTPATAATKGVPDWNFAELTQHLQTIKKQWPTLGVLTLEAADATPYRDIVQTMEIARKTIPVVLLGGF